MDRRRLEADLGTVVAPKGGGEATFTDGHALELLQEVDMEEGAAELAVGDALEPELLLPANGIADAIVLDLAKGRGLQLAFKEAIARIGQPARAQKAANLVSAERRPLGHPGTPLISSGRLWNRPPGG